ncbi:MAG: hypothetical protein KAG92_07350 [Deltaproteobacteria bacterium]|nr:hypothetical protein [Deltaproteobacteria bacterium]
MIDERKINEERGIKGRKYLTCEKYKDIFEVREGLECQHQHETCKYRLDCQIYLIGKDE